MTMMKASFDSTTSVPWQQVHFFEELTRADATVFHETPAEPNGEMRPKKRKGVAYLDTVVTGDDASILDFDVGRRMCELALAVRAGAFAALEFAAHLQLQPPGIFHIEHVV